MSRQIRRCPDCDSSFDSLARRDFLRVTSAAVAATAIPVLGRAADSPQSVKTPETVVKVLYDSLTPEQRKAVCFEWDHQDSKRGLLRTHVSNNWHITSQTIASPFYSEDQRRMVRDIFEGLIQPEWHERIDKQLKDDAGGFGRSQNIAIFGKPGEAKFELVMTGRHMTLRCDGNTADHVAFGGPIFYGHAASGFNEKPGHPNNAQDQPQA